MDRKGTSKAPLTRLTGGNGRIFALGRGALASLFFLLGQSAWADDVEAWFRHMARINRASPVEGAGSHGAWGVSVGAGAAIVPLEENSPLIEDQLSHAGGGSGTQVLPKVWVVKGTPLPLDIGAVGAAHPEGRLTQAGLYGQWTIFEEFRLPALAVRFGGSRLNGLKSSDVRSYYASMQTAYGISYFTVFAGYGLARHETTLRVDADEPSGYLLDDATDSVTFTDLWQERAFSIGAKVVIHPPFVSLSAEWQKGDGPGTLAAKLAVGL